MYFVKLSSWNCYWLNFVFFYLKVSESDLFEPKRSNSCSTIFIDDSTVSQPNLKSAIRLVACTIHFHIKRRTSDRTLDIFDEKLHSVIFNFMLYWLMI